jgi:hypothetical protein
MKLKYNAPKIELVEVISETYLASGSEGGQVDGGLAKRGFFDEDEADDATKSSALFLGRK